MMTHTNDTAMTTYDAFLAGEIASGLPTRQIRAASQQAAADIFARRQHPRAGEVRAELMPDADALYRAVMRRGQEWVPTGFPFVVGVSPVARGE